MNRSVGYREPKRRGGQRSKACFEELVHRLIGCGILLDVVSPMIARPTSLAARRGVCVLALVLLASVGEAAAQRSAYDVARECAMRGEHSCVIATLTAPSRAREYEILIASLR